MNVPIIRTEKIRVEDAYHPLGQTEFIDIVVSFAGKKYRGLLELE